VPRKILDKGLGLVVVLTGWFPLALAGAELSVPCWFNQPAPNGLLSDKVRLAITQDTAVSLTARVNGMHFSNGPTGIDVYAWLVETQGDSP